MGRAFLREFVGKPVTALFAIVFIPRFLTTPAYAYPEPTRRYSGEPKTLWLDDRIAHSKVVVAEQYKARKTSRALWLLEFLPAIGSIIGLLLLWEKDRRKAWAIFWGGLFWSFIFYPIIITVVIFVIVTSEGAH